MATIVGCVVLAAACSGANQIQPSADDAAATSDGEVALGPTAVAPDGADNERPATSVTSTATQNTSTENTAVPDTATPSTTEPNGGVPPLPTTVTTIPAEPTVVLAAGNLGGCDDHSTEVLAAIAARSETVIAAGDLSSDGSAEALQRCFIDPFGPDLDRLLAVPGDRDLAADDGAAFYELVAQTTATTTAGEGWFVTTLDDWQIIGLNSQCDAVDGCDADSAQFQWLDEVLAEQPAACRIAVFHEARFTSTIRQNDPGELGPLVGRLDGAGVDIIITGSTSNYERLGPIRPNGRPPEDGQTGIMHFNVGSIAGAPFDDERHPGSVVREGDVAGYLALSLGVDSYRWEFVGVSNDEPLVFDSGSADC